MKDQQLLERITLNSKGYGWKTSDQGHRPDSGIHPQSAGAWCDGGRDSGRIRRTRPRRHSGEFAVRHQVFGWFLSTFILFMGLTFLVVLPSAGDISGGALSATVSLPTPHTVIQSTPVAGLMLSQRTKQMGQEANVWYVATTGNDSNDCRSQATPCRTIQATIDKASNNDTINIAAGTYIENVFIFNKSLRLEGEDAELTIINGGDSGAVFSISINSSVDMSNVTIKNGYAMYGGGIYNSGRLNITNSVISENTVFEGGGGVYNNGTANITNCKISENDASSNGGGIYNRGTMTVTNSTLSSNTAGDRGGAIFAHRYVSWLNISASTVSSNSAGGFYGGAIFGDLGSVTGANNCIIGNSDVAVYINLEGAMDFTDNWWGTADGPALWRFLDGQWVISGGSGDSVSKVNVYYEPWLTEPPFDCVTGKPAIVLVHGWSGLSAGPEGLCSWPDPNGYFQSVDETLKREGYHIEYARLETSPCYTPPIADNVLYLRDAIGQAKARTGRVKVILVAHSMGGLVSRAYIEGSDYKDDVSALFTFGTPHKGAPADALVYFGGGGFLGILCATTQPVVCEMSYVGMSIFNEKYSRRAKNVIYHLISGDAPFFSRNARGMFMDALILGPDDGIVPTWSGKDLPDVFERWQTDEVHGPGPEVFGQRTYFIRDGELSRSYFECLEPILVEKDSSTCVSSGPLLSQAENELALAQRTPFEYGTLLAGQTVTRTISLESSAALFATQWQTGTVTVTLVDPIGQTIDPVYAADNPDTVSYDADEAIATYYFTNTIAGDWQLVLEAGSGIPAEGSTYVTFAAFDSNVSLAGSTDQYWYSPGATATITAALSGSPTNATVTATILRPDGVTETLSLLSIGGDHYQGTYTVPDASGYAEVSLVATGTIEDEYSFERGKNLAFQVSSNSVRLTGSYSDMPQPSSSGPPHYEVLLVTAGVSTTISGTIGLSADLLDADDNFVAHSSIVEEVNVGTSTLTLRFGGEDIYASQRNGPYTLTNLLLTDQRGATLVVAEVKDAYTTGVYEHRDFGLDTVILPVIMKNYTSYSPPSPADIDVTMNQVYTTDYFRAFPKETFRPGEVIVLTFLALNHTDETIPVTYTWSTHDPTGAKVPYLSWDDWAASVAPGEDRWSLEREVPHDAISGTYTYKATASHASGIASGSTRFTVDGPPIPVRLLEAVTAEYVDEYYQPVVVTDTFTTDDSYIVAWTAWEGAYGDHTIRWEWYAPDGRLFFDHPYDFSSTISLSYMWSWLTVSEMINDLGLWYVDIYMDDSYMETLYFTLEAGTQSHTSDKSGAFSSEAVGGGDAWPVSLPSAATPVKEGVQ